MASRRGFDARAHLYQELQASQFPSITWGRRTVTNEAGAVPTQGGHERAEEEMACKPSHKGGSKRELELFVTNHVSASLIGRAYNIIDN